MFTTDRVAAKKKKKIDMNQMNETSCLIIYSDINFNNKERKKNNEQREDKKYPTQNQVSHNI